MNVKSRRFILTDILFLVMAILPLVCGMVLEILTNVPSDGISVNGAQIFWESHIEGLPRALQFMITEAQVNSWLIMITILFLCLYLTHGIAAKPVTRRQLIVEWIVEQCDKLVHSNMGDYFMGFVPFIAGMMALSALSSLMGLLGLFPPTSDINVVGGWALLVFFLITYYKLKCGPWHYVKTLADPIALTPLNIIGEVATPISMAFRHYGNILSGLVISILIAAGLQGLSAMLLGWLPGFLGKIPFLQVGLPAVLSLYFDLFSSGLQAFIFAMLTMLYVSGAFAQDEYEQRKLKKLNKRRK